MAGRGGEQLSGGQSFIEPENAAAAIEKLRNQVGGDQHGSKGSTDRFENALPMRGVGPNESAEIEDADQEKRNMLNQRKGE